MPVVERSALADSPLADLHAIASELGVDGFRRLRRDDLIDAILERQGGNGSARPAEPGEAETDGEDGGPRRRRRRGGRGGRVRDEDEAPREEPEVRREEREEPEVRREEREEREERPTRRERGETRREEAPARRERPAAREERPARRERAEAPREESGKPERVVEGVVELQGNGSGFVRVSSPEASDEDVYVSAAQVRRCELVDGDRVRGPVRPPRRSERYPSLVRVEAINGAPADQAPEGVRFDDLPAAFPAERFALGTEDPTVQAIEFLTPIGKGSRVTIAGGPRAGKSEALRRLAAALAEIDGIECALVLASVRPEEIGAWREGSLAPVAALGLAASPDAQAQAIEQAIEHGRRIAARGGDAVVLIDTLDGLQPLTARKALAAARNIADGGSLTVIATAAAPLGGETTVVALDAEQAGLGRFPAIDLLASGTLRPELLVGEQGAEAIAQARAEAAE
jgi:transcription termination factor Rho